MITDIFCEYPLTRCRLTCEGLVAFCCYQRSHFNAPGEKAYLGNLFNNTFDEIWFGSLAEEIRKDTIRGRLHPLCQVSGCPFSVIEGSYPTKSVEYNEYPISMEIDLPNTHCNVGGLFPGPESPACIMCERSDPNFKPEVNRLTEVLEKIKHVVPNLKHMHIQGIAEPFYQTASSGFLLFDVLDALEFSNHTGIVLSVTTNGTLLRKAIRERYFTVAPDSVTTFSIDAATPETFQRIRILDCFDKVVENLCDFGVERNKARQRLRIHNNINTLNVHELVGMVQIAAKAGVDELEFNPTDGFNREIIVKKENAHLFVEAQTAAKQEADRLGVNCRFLRPLDMGLISTPKVVPLNLPLQRRKRR